jgi:hypothetical protein
LFQVVDRRRIRIAIVEILNFGCHATGRGENCGWLTHGKP